MWGGIGIRVEQRRPSTVVELRMASSISATSLSLMGFLALLSVIIYGGIRRVGRVGSSWNGLASFSGNWWTLLHSVGGGHQGMHCIVQRRYVRLCFL